MSSAAALCCRRRDQLQNRGASFSLDARRCSLKPGKKPFHTLNPAAARLKDGRVDVYGTMGGRAAATQAAVFTRHGGFGQPLQARSERAALAARRTWGQTSDTLKLERRFSPRSWRTWPVAACGRADERLRRNHGPRRPGAPPGRHTRGRSDPAATARRRVSEVTSRKSGASSHWPARHKAGHINLENPREDSWNRVSLPKCRSPRRTLVASQASLRSNVPPTRSAGHSARCAEGPHRPRS